MAMYGTHFQIHIYMTISIVKIISLFIFSINCNYFRTAVWTMPHQSKLKFTQLFNTHDRNKRGFLTGVCLVLSHVLCVKRERGVVSW